MKMFPIFEQNLGLTPLKQFQYVHCVKSISFSSRKVCFLTGWSKNIISRPILSKNKRRGNYDFWPKSCEIHIFIVREGLFSSWTLLADCMTYWYTFLITAQLGYRLIDLISKWFLTLTLFTNWMNSFSWLYGSWWIAWLCYMQFIFWFIYCELYDESQICLALRKLQREWVLAFGAINCGIVWETVKTFWSWKGR